MKFVIDAGHGPDTPGKRTPDGSMREYQFNSAVARYAAELLTAYEGVQTLFTHAADGSRDVPLKERTDRANVWGATALVSIHANASGDGWSAAEGLETFVYTNPSAASPRLAEAVQKALVAATGLRDRGVKRANFHMVRECKMPSVLVECGFMSNRREAELLKTEGYRRRCAEAIVSGLVAVYGLKKKQTQGEKPTVEKKTDFKDVPAGHWGENSIAAAVKAGVITGISPDTFGLGEPVTREQLCVILDRAGLLLKEGK